jgi:hypothetical protein
MSSGEINNFHLDKSFLFHHVYQGVHPISPAYGIIPR